MYIKTTCILILAIFIMSPFASSDSKIKQPNVSGQFYSADSRQLSSDIEKFFSEANVQPYEQHIDVVIAPHAGYIYSGGVAVYGFKAASQNTYKTIVILAPSHFFGFDGISIWDEGGFKTPLGVVEVDQQLAERLILADKKFYFEPLAFEQEHSLEVEIPFLQKTFKNFKIVPIIMGQVDLSLLREFASALNEAIGQNKDILIVVSSDMSHYHDDAFARRMDSHTIEVIKGLKVEQFWKESHAGTTEMCGFIPVTAALLYAQQKGLDNVDVLKYANSSEVTGDRDRVVGYTSIVIYGHDKNNLQSSNVTLTLEQKRHLMEIARKTIEKYVRTGEILEVQEEDSRLNQEEGAFVTIHKHGQLRGCIGNILGRGPLYLTVRDMAIASASNDHRFTPVKKEELNQIDVEISVLTKPKVIKSVDEIQLGIHGVIVSHGPFHSGVFLPQVADETGWTKEQFLSQLCSQKAGLAPDAWKDAKTKIEIFTAEVFSEKDIQ